MSPSIRQKRTPKDGTFIAHPNYARSESLHVAHRRWNYDPAIGAWEEQDQVGYVDGANLYDFARNAPPGVLDPSGDARIVPFDESFTRTLMLLDGKGNVVSTGKLEVKFKVEEGKMDDIDVHAD